MMVSNEGSKELRRNQILSLEEEDESDLGRRTERRKADLIPQKFDQAHFEAFLAVWYPRSIGKCIGTVQEVSSFAMQGLDLGYYTKKWV